MKVFRGQRVLLTNGDIVPASVLVKDGQIAEISTDACHHFSGDIEEVSGYNYFYTVDIF